MIRTLRSVPLSALCIKVCKRSPSALADPGHVKVNLVTCVVDVIINDPMGDQCDAQSTNQKINDVLLTNHRSVSPIT